MSELVLYAGLIIGLLMVGYCAKAVLRAGWRADFGAVSETVRRMEIEISEGGDYALFFFTGYPRSNGGVTVRAMKDTDEGSSAIEVRYPFMRQRIRRRGVVGVHYCSFRLPEAGFYEIRLDGLVGRAFDTSTLPITKRLSGKIQWHQTKYLLRRNTPWYLLAASIVGLVIGINMIAWASLLLCRPHLFE